MRMKDALKIMVDGKNKHFDENLVNAFMSISAYEILKIIVNDVNCDFKDDEILLKEFNLSQLYDILNMDEDSITEKQKELIKTFDKYYYNSKG